LREWREPVKLLKMCRLIVAPRPGCPRPDLKGLERSIPGITQRTVFLDKPMIDISATDIRELAAEGKPIDHLVPAPVAEYIKKNGLYRK
jgi:nicotinate-nucleotide adenylyltransferase